MFYHNKFIIRTELTDVLMFEIKCCNSRISVFLRLYSPNTHIHYALYTEGQGEYLGKLSKFLQFCDSNKVSIDPITQLSLSIDWTLSKNAES